MIEVRRNFEHRLTSVEERSQSNSHRLKDMEKRQDNLDDLVGIVKALAVREEKVESDVKEIKSDVKSVLSKPSKRWDGLIDKIFYTIVGIIIAYVMTQVGF